MPSSSSAPGTPAAPAPDTPPASVLRFFWCWLIALGCSTLTTALVVLRVGGTQEQTGGISLGSVVGAVVLAVAILALAIAGRLLVQGRGRLRIPVTALALLYMVASIVLLIGEINAQSLTRVFSVVATGLALYFLWRPEAGRFLAEEH